MFRHGWQCVSGRVLPQLGVLGGKTTCKLRSSNVRRLAISKIRGTRRSGKMQPPPRNAKRKLWPVAESRWQEREGRKRFVTRIYGARGLGSRVPFDSAFEPQQLNLNVANTRPQTYPLANRKSHRRSPSEIIQGLYSARKL